ncbi:hypothetical protein VZT92_015043 [Zoarces viviparus]|uniref:Uncharacterized protein n=1 Tax=Zoarces viviparus TaxID=48416 RepID=A0AAW1EVT8_ZOAVI
MLLVQCVTRKSSPKDTTEDPYGNEKKQPPQGPLPVHSPQTPVTQTAGSAPVIIGDTPKKNRTGFYSVNP